MLALARFAAFVTVDRGLIDRTTNDGTIVGDDEDVLHVTLALAKFIHWIGKQDEARQMGEYMLKIARYRRCSMSAPELNFHAAKKRLNEIREQREVGYDDDVRGPIWHALWDAYDVIEDTPLPSLADCAVKLRAFLSPQGFCLTYDCPSGEASLKQVLEFLEQQ